MESAGNIRWRRKQRLEVPVIAEMPILRQTAWVGIGIWGM
jgi:hypothetical protein